MKYWHKRVTIESFYELDDNLKLEALAEYDLQANEMEYLVGDNFFWPLDEFMRVDDSRYHGVATITNTSALGLIIGSDNYQAVVQCFG